MSTWLKATGPTAEREVMQAMSSMSSVTALSSVSSPPVRRSVSRLTTVPVPIWVVGMTTWALAFHRVFSELLG